MTHYDVAIIGAGMSGLAAAIRLAHFGKKVCIFERHTVWGGLNSFYKKGGHHFDVGLHAVTNYVKPNYKGPRIPLQLIARQLRIPVDAFALRPQSFSQTVFESTTLTWDNNIERLREQVREKFPSQIDGFVRLEEACAHYPNALEVRPFVSTRQKLSEFITDPLLIDMLMCPLLYYGSAVEGDVDFGQFITLFNSIYREGFGRPDKGVKHILNLLLARLKEVDGEMRRKCGVRELRVQNDRVSEIVLDNGEVVTADAVISSAGWVETERLRSDKAPQVLEERAGQLGFVENIFVLNRSPKDLGLEATITFFNHGDQFQWQSPEQLVDLNSGVLCAPDNYLWEEPPAEHHLRVTHLANWSKWFGLPREQYYSTKDEYIALSRQSVKRFVGDFEEHINYIDGFSPTTVTKFTGHINGAIYGSPEKQVTGKTELNNLFLCGTDQGMLGIVGAMVSGVTVANAYGMNT